MFLMSPKPYLLHLSQMGHSSTKLNPFSASPIFGQVQKFFLENLLLARFLCWRDISRDLFFFREGFEVFFSYKHEKNEKSNQK